MHVGAKAAPAELTAASTNDHAMKIGTRVPPWLVDRLVREGIRATDREAWARGLPESTKEKIVAVVDAPAPPEQASTPHPTTDKSGYLAIAGAFTAVAVFFACYLSTEEFNPWLSLGVPALVLAGFFGVAFATDRGSWRLTRGTVSEAHRARGKAIGLSLLVGIPALVGAVAISLWISGVLREILPEDTNWLTGLIRGGSALALLACGAFVAIFACRSARGWTVGRLHPIGSRSLYDEGTSATTRRWEDELVRNWKYLAGFCLCAFLPIRLLTATSVAIRLSRVDELRVVLAVAEFARDSPYTLAVTAILAGTVFGTLYCYRAMTAAGLDGLRNKTMSVFAATLLTLTVLRVGIIPAIGPASNSAEVPLVETETQQLDRVKKNIASGNKLAREREFEKAAKDFEKANAWLLPKARSTRRRGGIVELAEYCLFMQAMCSEYMALSTGSKQKRFAYRPWADLQGLLDRFKPNKEVADMIGRRMHGLRLRRSPRRGENVPTLDGMIAVWRTLRDSGTLSEPAIADCVAMSADEISALQPQH